MPKSGKHDAWRPSLRIGVLGLSLLIAGCAGPLFCPDTSAFQMGSDAAYIGHEPEIFAQYQDRCVKAGRALDKAEWDRGYQAGLRRYCTVARAYQIGFQDYRTFHADRCPAAQGRDLAAAFTHGKACGEIQEDLDDLYEEREEDPPDTLAGALVGGFIDMLREEALKKKWQDLRCY